MTDNTKPEPSEELREPTWAEDTMFAINKLTPDVKGKAFDPDWFLLRQRLEQFEPRIRSEERERAKAEVAAAYQDAINIVMQGRAITNFAHVPSVVRALEWVWVDLSDRTPADASRAFELAILDARILAMKQCYELWKCFPLEFETEIAGFIRQEEAQRDALAKEAAK